MAGHVPGPVPWASPNHYVEQTEQAYAEQTRQKMEKQFHRRAREPGYEVKLIEPVTPTLVT